MRSFWTEPFLWIHLAGIAVLPLTLQATWLGLAVGEPIPFFWLEFLLLAAVGIVPITLMQLRRPFDIFSLLLVAVRPEALTPRQQQILSLFTAGKQRLLTAVGVLIMLVILWQIYRVAPLAAVAASSLPQVRLLGLMIAAVAFLLSNLFIQVPLSVLGVLLTGEQVFAAAEPLSPDQIRQKFIIPGFRVNRILPASVTNSTES
ncbi:MAG: low-complexity tail membrane protein [Cyanophyceae cyanobacterium]